jgi:hypothetical protein
MKKHICLHPRVRSSLLILLLAAPGCGTPRGDVSGTVTYRGKPVVYGSVMFVGADNLPIIGRIQPDGTYMAFGVLGGDNRIAVNSPEPEPPERPSEAGSRQPLPFDRSLWFVIPERYGDPRASGISISVTRGSNSFDIKLD